jgi:hypothetical protein
MDSHLQSDGEEFLYSSLLIKVQDPHSQMFTDLVLCFLMQQSRLPNVF